MWPGCWNSCGGLPQHLFVPSICLAYLGYLKWILFSEMTNWRAEDYVKDLRSSNGSEWKSWSRKYPPTVPPECYHMKPFIVKDEVGNLILWYIPCCWLYSVLWLIVFIGSAKARGPSLPQPNRNKWGKAGNPSKVTPDEREWSSIVVNVILWYIPGCLTVFCSVSNCIHWFCRGPRPKLTAAK